MSGEQKLKLKWPMRFSDLDLSPDSWGISFRCVQRGEETNAFMTLKGYKLILSGPMKSCFRSETV